MNVQRWMERERWGHIDPAKCHVFGGKWIDGSPYNRGSGKPRYPLPTKIGAVEWMLYPGSLEIIITDCDDAFDPRMCISVGRPWDVFDGFVITDQPNNSPNYR